MRYDHNWDPFKIPSAGEILEMIGHKPEPEFPKEWEIELTLDDRRVGHGVRTMTKSELIAKLDEWYYPLLKAGRCPGYTFRPFKK